MAELGLVDPALVSDGTVLRVRKAYPVYDGQYQAGRLGGPRFSRDARQPPAGRPQRDASLQQPGPFDAHRDHGRPQHLGERHDLWNLLADSEYLEQGSLREDDISELERTQPAVPVRVTR